MNGEQSKALRDLAETMAVLDVARRELERVERVRDRRIMRAVAVGVDRVDVAAVAEMSRQRVGQIAAGVEKGAGKAQVAAVAKLGATPRTGAAAQERATVAAQLREGAAVVNG